MAADKEKNNDFYGVLGLEKESTAEELRNSYKKLALNKGESFQELHGLFKEMIQSDIEAFGSSSATPSTCSSLSYTSCVDGYNTTNKRNSSELSSNNFNAEATYEGFCIGVPVSL